MAATPFQRDLYLEVEEISADIADLKKIMAKILEVQEKQQKSLETIAACLEKISKTYHLVNGGTGAFVMTS